MSEKYKPTMTPEEQELLDTAAGERLDAGYKKFYHKEGNSYSPIDPDLKDMQSLDTFPEGTYGLPQEGKKHDWVAKTTAGDMVDFSLYGGERYDAMEKVPYYGLSERDRAILQKATPEIISQMLKHEPWPKIIVIPETSGRPLAYLFKPIFEKIAQSTGKQVPEFQFFKTIGWKQEDEYFDYYLSELKAQPEIAQIFQQEPVLWTEEENNLVFEFFKKIFYLNEGEFSKFKNDLDNRIQMENRGREILEKTKGDISEIAIIDESMVDGDTYRFICESLGDHDRKINFYPIIAREYTVQVDYYTDGDEERAIDSFPNVHPGVLIGDDNPKKDTVLDYKMVKRPRAVDKHNQTPYVTGTIHGEIDRIEARNLRNDLYNLGLEISNTIS